LREDDHAARRQIHYTDKQKRQAEHIEEGYEHRGVGKKEAERRAWATVNEETGGGNKSGPDAAVPDTNVSSETRRQDRRTARRKASAKAVGRGADRAPQKKPPNTQAKRNGEVGSAQSRAEEIALRRPARACRKNRRGAAKSAPAVLSKVRRSRHWDRARLNRKTLSS